MGHGGRHRNVAWGAETSNGCWRVTGAGGSHIKADGALNEEMMWGAGAIYRGSVN